MSNTHWMDLSQVNFPAITFCHQGNTRMAIAERLMNAVGDNNNHPKVRQLRNIFLSHTIDFINMNLYFKSSDLVAQDYANECVQNKIWQYCRRYDLFFSYGQIQNLTIEQVN